MGVCVTESAFTRNQGSMAGAKLASRTNFGIGPENDPLRILSLEGFWFTNAC